MKDPIRPGNAHEEAEALLPWYATGRLDPADRAFVDDHLSSCVLCRRRLSLERVLVDEYQSLTPEVDTGWARLRDRIESPSRTRPSILRTATEIWLLLKRPAVAVLATAQIGLLIFAVTLLPWLSRPTYEVLGASEVSSAANVIVIFRSDTKEADLRRVLNATGASLVGGPTSADAYLLHVPADTRRSALTKLRTDANVTMAEPVDGATS